MKIRDYLSKLLIQVFSIILFTALGAQARKWTSADGKSNFEGELIEYKADSGDVTVERAGKRMTFKQQILSAADIEFLKNTKATPVTPATTPKPAESTTPTTPTTPVSSIVKNTALLENGKLDYTFTPLPLANGRPWLIKTFGPVGIGIMLEKGLVMKIQNVEVGSPSEKTGKLKQGDVIVSINGLKLTDTKRDPRLLLADIITEAEATDGKIHLEINGKGIVTVEIPVLGRYSKTWPLNCPKSDKIVRNLADLIAKGGKDEWGSVLFLLSTGEEKDLEVVRGWMKELKNGSWEHNWAVGVRGMGICEYYLRTGDASVLPLIQKGADHLRDRIYNGGWSGRGASYNYQAGGHLNAAGVHCVTFLMLAKTCGVNVDEKTLQSSLSHFFEYSGKGCVPYGDFVAKPGYGGCNGKNGGLALAMTAAARLTPDGENSIYAKAAQVNAMVGYYSTHVYCVGHTGGGIGEIWKSAGMGQVAETRPKQFHEYANTRRWALELSRRYNGGMGIGGGSESNYDRATGEANIAFGTFYGLNYTMARKHLHLFGAPLSKWAKSYQLPTRPIGTTPADDDFNSPFPVPGGPLSDEDSLKETFNEHGGLVVNQLLLSDKVSDETIRTYLHHPDLTHRFDAMAAVLRLKKDAILLELLRSKDARLRYLGIMAVHELLGTWRPSTPEQKLRATSEIMVEVDKIIRNPEESRFIRGWAVTLLQHADLARLRTFRTLLAELIEKGPADVSAIHASMPMLVDPESYQIIFPAMMKAITNSTSYPLSMSTSGKIRDAMDKASPEIKAYGLKQLKDLYGQQPKNLLSNDTGIYVIPEGSSAKLRAIGQSLSFTPEGEQFMKIIPKLTLKAYISGKDSDMFTFSGKFQNDKKYLGTWAWAVWPNPKNPSQIDSAIQNWIKSRKGNLAPDANSKDTVELRDDGTFQSTGYYGRSKGQYYWSGDTAFGVNSGEACKMEIRTFDGHDFLIIECGGFVPAIPKEGEVEATAVPADYHCGYHVYVRKPQAK